MQGRLFSYTDTQLLRLGGPNFHKILDAHKVRDRSKSFSDHFSQAKLFFNSQTEIEQNHIIKALRFELSKVDTTAIRVRMVGLLSQVSLVLAEKVAEGLGLTVPLAPQIRMQKSRPAQLIFGLAKV